MGRLLASSGKGSVDQWDVEDDPDLLDEPVMELDIQVSMTRDIYQCV